MMLTMVTTEIGRLLGRTIPNTGRPQPPAVRPANPDAVRARIAAYGILHTGREATFDRLVFTTAQIFRVPIALIALIAENGFWLKARVGLDLSELPVSAGLQTVIDHEDVLVVEDVTRDVRFAASPLLAAPPRCRLMAGAPLVTPDGLRVGCLCIMDRTSKPLLGKQVWQLGQLARSVVGLLEGRLPSSVDIP